MHQKMRNIFHGCGHGMRGLRGALAIVPILFGIWFGECANAQPVQELPKDIQARIELATKQSGANFETVAATLQELIVELERQKRFDDMLTVGTPLLQQSIARYGAESPLVAVRSYIVASAYFQLEKAPEAMSHLRQSCPIILAQDYEVYQQLGAKCLSLMAKALHAEGEYRQAIAVFEQSLVIARNKFGEQHVEVAIILANFGLTLLETGDYDRALQNFQQARRIFENQKQIDFEGLAKVVNNIGAVHMRLNQYSAALDFHQQSLAMQEQKLGARHIDVATSLNNLAQVYAALGEKKEALALLKRSLDIYEQNSGKASREVAIVLMNIAAAHASLEQYADAVPVFQRALQIFENKWGPDHVWVALCLNNFATIYVTAGMYEQALPLFKRSLAIYEKHLDAQHISIALSLYNLGYSHLKTGQSALGMAELFRSLRIAETNVAGLEMSWRVQFGLSVAAADMGEADQAVYWGKLAVNNLQKLRSINSSLNRDLQFSLVQERSPAYTRLADSLIAQGRVAEAQQVLLMLKERELYEEVRRGEGTNPSALQVELVGVERSKNAEYYKIRDEQVSLIEERQALQALPEGRRSPAQQQRLDAILKEKLPAIDAAAKRFFASLPAELSAGRQALIDDAREASARQSELRSLVEAMARPGGSPNAKAVALQYVVAEKRLSIILTVPGGPPVLQQVNSDYKSLSQKITRFTLDLKSPNSDLASVQAQARELYRLLIEPVQADLQKAGAHTLMLSLTDVLRFVPFAALHDGRQYLMQRYALAQYNEASRNAMSATSKPQWRVAALGLSEPVGGLQALASVPAELESVSHLAPGGRQWLNEPFNRGRLQAVSRGDFDVLHLASHFVVSLGDTSRSRLYLGDKSTLSLGQMDAEDIRFDGVDLVTLSACETAVGGGKTSYGQEMESLGATIQRQGASAVIATLWKVADTSTGALMTRFYQEKLKKSQNKAEALRLAQIELAEGRVRPPNSERSNWQHPFFWAPFVLMGNWR